MSTVTRTFDANGTFTPVAGITEYTIKVIGGGGGRSNYQGLAGASNTQSGGNAAIIVAKCINLTVLDKLSIKIGGGGEALSTDTGAGGGGLSQVFNLANANATVSSKLNIIAGGGGGGGKNFNGKNAGLPPDNLGVAPDSSGAIGAAYNPSMSVDIGTGLGGGGYGGIGSSTIGGSGGGGDGPVRRPAA